MTTKAELANIIVRLLDNFDVMRSLDTQELYERALSTLPLDLEDMIDDEGFIRDFVESDFEELEKTNMMLVNTKTKLVITEIVLDGIVTLKAGDDLSLDLWEDDEEVRFFIKKIEQKQLPETMQLLNQNFFFIENLFPVYEHPNGNELEDVVIVGYSIHVFCKFATIKEYLKDHNV